MVTVTATDSAGFTSTASGPIAVAQGPPRGGGKANQPPVSTIKALPRHAHVVRKLRGIATDDEGVDGVADVEVALVGVVKLKGHKVCERLVDEGLLHHKKLSRHGHCKRPPFVEADGTVTWSVKLAHALPAGSWVAYSRATDAEGLVESTFAK